VGDYLTSLFSWESADALDSDGGGRDLVAIVTPLLPDADARRLRVRSSRFQPEPWGRAAVVILLVEATVP